MMNRPYQADVNINLVERWMSMALGGLLTTRGIRGGGLRGLLITLLGGYLTQRGLTGHCLVYEALGMNTASPTTEPATTAMMSQETPRQPSRSRKTTRSSNSGGGQFDQQADQAEGERDEGAKSRKVGRTPDQAEGSESNVDASLQQGS
jgi:hypothetical protein